MSNVKKFDECFKDFISELYKRKDYSTKCHVCGEDITEDMDVFTFYVPGEGYRYYCSKEHYKKEVGECEVCGEKYLLGDSCHEERQRKTNEEELMGF